MNRWLSMVDGLAQFAGKEHGFVFSVPIDFRTGEVSIYNDEAVEAVELLFAMRDDGRWAYVVRSQDGSRHEAGMTSRIQSGSPKD